MEKMNAEQRKSQLVVEEAVKSFIFEEHDHCVCTVCLKDFKKAKNMMLLKKHIEAQHPGSVQNEVVTINSNRRKDRVRFLRESIDEWYGDQERAYKKKKAEFQKCIAENTMTYAIKSYSEEMVKEEETFRLVMQIGSIIKTTLTEEVKSYWELLSLLEEEWERMVEDVLRNPWRHNCTNAMSNFVEAWELEARSKFVDKISFGGSGLSVLIRYIKELKNTEIFTRGSKFF